MLFHDPLHPPNQAVSFATSQVCQQAVQSQQQAQPNFHSKVRPWIVAAAQSTFSTNVDDDGSLGSSCRLLLLLGMLLFLGRTFRSRASARRRRRSLGLGLLLLVALVLVALLFLCSAWSLQRFFHVRLIHTRTYLVSMRSSLSSRETLVPHGLGNLPGFVPSRVRLLLLWGHGPIDLPLQTQQVQKFMLSAATVVAWQHFPTVFALLPLVAWRMRLSAGTPWWTTWASGLVLATSVRTRVASRRTGANWWLLVLWLLPLLLLFLVLLVLLLFRPGPLGRSTATLMACCWGNTERRAWRRCNILWRSGILQLWRRFTSTAEILWRRRHCPRPARKKVTWFFGDPDFFLGKSCIHYRTWRMASMWKSALCILYFVSNSERMSDGSPRRTSTSHDTPHGNIMSPRRTSNIIPYIDTPRRNI